MLRQPPPPPLGEVLPDAGSELPADSDRAAVVCTAPMDEAVDYALFAVGLHVGQLWFRTDSKDVLSMMTDEHSMMCDLVRPDSVPVDKDYMSTDVRGDNRFAPGVRDGASLDWQIDLDSHGVEPWECLLVSGDSSVACLSDWRSDLRLFAPMSGSPEFPDTGDTDFCLRKLISREDLIVMSEGTVPWILVLGRCVPGLGCLKLVCGCLLRHCRLFRLGRSGRIGGNLTARRDFPARARRLWRNCGGRVHRRGRVCWRGRLGLYKYKTGR